MLERHNKEEANILTSVDPDRQYINWNGAITKENQTYAGYLKKQGALFKQWKERYFVLDSLKYQVRIVEDLDFILVNNLKNKTEAENFEGLEY